jgi:hypothetical protein
MSRNQKAPTPAPQEATPAPGSQSATKSKGKKFSFSFGFLRKENGDKGFEGKVAPSKRELEAQSAKRKAHRAKTQGGLKQQPAPALEAESEAEERVAQPV